VDVNLEKNAIFTQVDRKVVNSNICSVHCVKHVTLVFTKSFVEYFSLCCCLYCLNLLACLVPVINFFLQLNSSIMDLSTVQY